MAKYQFDGSISKTGTVATEQSGLNIAVLFKNARWFIQIRWLVIAMLMAAGYSAMLFPLLFSRLSLTPPTQWPFLLALILTVANPLYLLSLRNIKKSTHALKTNLWAQILIDLIVLTALVHFTGSLETPVSIAYLFHVALACIFFSPKQSLWVTVSAGILFMTCITLEATGVINGGGIIAMKSPVRDSSPLFMIAGSGITVASWVIIWYLISTLSKKIQARDFKLSEANRQLQEAMTTKNRDMIRVVHDLKAPFSGIETMVQTLQFIDKDGISEKGNHILDRLQIRAGELRGRINELLTLGKLRSDNIVDMPIDNFDIIELLKESISELTELADSKKVKVALSGPTSQLSSNRHYMGILIANLVSNAIIYSQENGTVDISVNKKHDDLVLNIQDHGIGIREDALPLIFDEFYRTTEASAHNSQSTGMGLAIVKEVASVLKLKVDVSSSIGKGTNFSIQIPCHA